MARKPDYCDRRCNSADGASCSRRGCTASCQLNAECCNVRRPNTCVEQCRYSKDCPCNLFKKFDPIDQWSDNWQEDFQKLRKMWSYHARFPDEFTFDKSESSDDDTNVQCRKDNCWHGPRPLSDNNGLSSGSPSIRRYNMESLNLPNKDSYTSTNKNFTDDSNQRPYREHMSQNHSKNPGNRNDMRYANSPKANTNKAMQYDDAKNRSQKHNKTPTKDTSRKAAGAYPKNHTGPPTYTSRPQESYGAESQEHSEEDLVTLYSDIDSNYSSTRASDLNIPFMIASKNINSAKRNLKNEFDEDESVKRTNNYRRN